DLGLFEINESATLVSDAAHPDANIIFGAVIDDALGDEVRVTVIAAGFDGGQPKKRVDLPLRSLEAAAHGSGSWPGTPPARSAPGRRGGRPRGPRAGGLRRRAGHPRLPQAVTGPSACGARGSGGHRLTVGGRRCAPRPPCG